MQTTATTETNSHYTSCTNTVCNDSLAHHIASHASTNRCTSGTIVHDTRLTLFKRYRWNLCSLNFSFTASRVVYRNTVQSLQLLRCLSPTLPFLALSAKRSGFQKCPGAATHPGLGLTRNHAHVPVNIQTTILVSSKHRITLKRYGPLHVLPTLPRSCEPSDSSDHRSMLRQVFLFVNHICSGIRRLGTVNLSQNLALKRSQIVFWILPMQTRTALRSAADDSFPTFCATVQWSQRFDEMPIILACDSTNCMASCQTFKLFSGNPPV